MSYELTNSESTLSSPDVFYMPDNWIYEIIINLKEFKSSPDLVIDAKGLFVVPGFIDIQINGAFGVDFSQTSADFDEQKVKADLTKVSKGLLRTGCTSFIPTLISSEDHVYKNMLPLIGPRKGNLKNGAEILGSHVEGPFITPEKCGVHEKYKFKVLSNGFSDFENTYGSENIRNSIKLITVAPEVEGVLDNIERLVKSGITVSIGHSAATVVEAESAIKKGFHHRDPGIIGLLGTTCIKRPYYGVICDGIHVHPNSIKIAYDSHPKGAIVVTDAISAMGLPPGDYELGDIHVRKQDEKVEIVGTRTLAGSVITIDESVRNFKKFTGCSIVEAIEAATLHPAELLGIQNRKGTLNTGSDADLLFLDDDLKIIRCFIAGEEFDMKNNDF
ncbi:13209_t:CDS:2 [Entrophospora sp. SA101]|nr:13209_t:CDS:2 [Entrophospora sp. SA101]